MHGIWAYSDVLSPGSSNASTDPTGSRTRLALSTSENAHQSVEGYLSQERTCLRCTGVPARVC